MRFKIFQKVYYSLEIFFKVSKSHEILDKYVNIMKRLDICFKMSQFVLSRSVLSRIVLSRIVFQEMFCLEMYHKLVNIVSCVEMFLKR